jgi:PAS domain S-box-containing protein
VHALAASSRGSEFEMRPLTPKPHLPSDPLARVHRALRMTRACGRLIARTTSEQTLLDEVCALAVREGGYRMAWIGFAVDDAEQSVRPASRAGHDEGYIDLVRATWGAGTRGSGPVGTCIRTGRPAVLRDVEDPGFAPWHAEATRRGYASVACLPIRSDERVLGMLALYAGARPAFDADEVELLADLADDIAFGLRALRADVRRGELETSLEEQLTRLRQREAEYRTILQTSIDGFTMVDASGRFLDVNDAFCGMSGYAREELLGMEVADLPAVPDDRGEHLSDLVGGRSQRARIRLQRRDGRRVDLEISASFLDLHGGRLAAFVRDVSEEVRSEAVLRETQARLYRVLGSAPVALLAVDAAGTITLAEGRALAAVGPAVAGRAATEVFGDGTPFDAAYRRALAGESTSALVQVGSRVLEAHLSPMRAADGAVVGASCVALDVTEREEAAAALQRTEEQSRLYQQQFLQAQKLEAVGRLAGGVAHDFNNILSAINGYADLLVSELAEDDPRREDAAEIARAGQRAAALTRQLLLFSRRDRPVLETIELAEAISAVSQMLRRLIGEDVTVLTELQPATVRADRGQLEQMVVNFVLNSRDAMPDGGTVAISTGLLGEVAGAGGAKGARYAFLRVSDDGCGMTDEVRAHLFEPFFTTKERGKGTGLGLATVYGIVQQLGGRIDVSTGAGKGTTFTVMLPLVPVESASAHAPPPETSTSLDATETVLVVEDDDAVRRFVCKVLDERGYRVLEAADGAEAVRLCETHPQAIDAVLTDVVMPGMNGRDVSRAVARLRPGTKVAYMSGHSEDVIARQELATSGAPMLEKPFSPDVLLRAIRQLLAREGA